MRPRKRARSKCSQKDTNTCSDSKRLRMWALFVCRHKQNRYSMFQCICGVYISIMDNIVNYLKHNFDVLGDREFGAVDSLILSQLSYVNFAGIVAHLRDRAKPVRIQELLKAEMYESMFANMRDIDTHLDFLHALAASPRFRQVQLNHYVNHTDPVTEKQFAAVTFLLGDNTAYIAYRGTDSTYIGWKEDFNMAYMSPIPSQEEGVEYLNAVAKRLPMFMKILTGGHSKGGNIAIYSAMKCNTKTQKRIVSVYNHDGPGFKAGLFDSPEYQNMKRRIHTTLPEESLVGMLLQHHEDYSVVKSSRHGFKQHDPFTWIVENGDFSYADGIKEGVLKRNHTLNEWLSTLTNEKRKAIIDALFEVLEKTQTDNFYELSEEWQKSATALLYAIKNIDPETKKFIFQTITELAKLSFKKLLKSKDKSSFKKGLVKSE